MSSHQNYLRYEKKIAKVWDNINRGRFCKAMIRTVRINRRVAPFLRIGIGHKNHPLDKAFKEALIAQLFFTLPLIPPSEPLMSKPEIDLQIKNLLK